MQDFPFERVRGEFVMSTDRNRLDIDAALALLHTTDWAATMPKAALERAVANSVCFGVYAEDKLVGFARAVSDLATYSYLTDVVVDKAYRGRGLGAWLVECILAHPDMQGLRRIALRTRDAQGLYARFGFQPGLELGTSTYMELTGPNTPM